MKLSPKIIAIVSLVSCLTVLVINVIGYLALKIWWVNSVGEYLFVVMAASLMVYISSLAEKNKNYKRKGYENVKKNS